MSRRPRDLVTSAGLLFEAAYFTERALAQATEGATGLPSQWIEVLIRLSRTPGQAARMNDMAAQVMFAPSSFSRLADKMEQAGLVARQPDPAHRRATLLSLTASGEQLLEQAQPAQAAALTRHLADLLTDDELDELEHLSRRLRSANAPAGAFTTHPE